MSKFTFFLVLSLLLSACSPEKTPPSPQANSIPVIAIHPVIKNIPLYIESIGFLEPSASVEVHPQVNGMLEEILMHEGEEVNRDKPLFKIDSTVYYIQLQEAEAQLRVSQSDLQLSQKKLARFQKLQAQDLIAQSEWDELEAHVEKARALVAIHAAKMRHAQVDFDHCLVTAPIQGRLGKCNLHVGANLNTQTSLITLTQLDPLTVEFYITQQEFEKMNPEHLVLEIESLSQIDSNHISEKGTITFLDSQFDGKSGLLLVRGRVINSKNRWRPGQSIRVKIPLSTTLNCRLIPQKAVRYNEKGPYVYIVNKDQQAEIRQLILGEENGTDLIILEGLESSDLIVTDGYLRLSPGAKVEIKS
jgi:membrane fusion protein, multidrug efflux system